MTRAWTTFSIQTVPFFLLALVSMFVGLQFSSRSAGSNLLPATLVGLLLFAALITFKKARGWNIALLLSLALVLGFIIGGLLSSENKSEAPVVVLRTLFLLIVAALLGSLLGQRTAYFGVSLWVASWIHVFGWVVIMITQLSFTFIQVWAVIGLFIFTGLSIVWFGRLEDHLIETTGPALAIDLYFLSINLSIVIFILSGMNGL
jgi:hypothetical protein